MGLVFPARIVWWAWVWPASALAVLLARVLLGGGLIADATAGVVLIAAVFGAVYHAEVIAHRVGEPFGTLILAVAVTTIEVTLIVSVMAGGGTGKVTLARD